MDLDEAFAPYDHELGISARQIRRYWRTAAWLSLTTGDFRGAGEAWRNSLRRFPPHKWSTGTPLISIELK